MGEGRGREAADEGQDWSSRGDDFADVGRSSADATDSTPTTDESRLAMAPNSSLLSTERNRQFN